MVDSWEELYKKYGVKQKNRRSNRYLIIAAFVLILGVLSLSVLQQNKSGAIASSQENPNIGNINENQSLEGGTSIKPKCMSDTDCNDNNASTTDICENPGLPSSFCQNNLKTCEEQGKNICSPIENCSGSWIISSDSTRCCSADCARLQCSDGTLYGQCSATKPKYCNAGALVDKCGAPQNCGCPSGQTCQPDGSCISVGSNCTENWNCTGWSGCTNNIQARTCADKNSCGTSVSKPATSQNCISCIESWNCGAWSACINNQQARNCIDNNACGTYASKPLENQPCISDSDNDGDPDSTDCAPTDAAMHHGAADICDNGMDENCDGLDSECATPYTISVLDLSYIPTANGKVDISKTGDWQNEDINALISNIDSLRNGLVDTLEKGSIYHGYKDQSALPSLNYEIYEKKIIYTAVPPSPQFKGMDNAPSADHMKILNDLNICDYVESKGVKEVWIWMYHTQQVAPIESNMAGPYGDISNSYREADLPVCQKTYTVYDYNYGRSYSMAVEDHTHQIEAVLNYVDSSLFWNIFVGTNNGGGKCGWTHYPPNGRYDYDWNNQNSVLSDCEEWRPDGSGQKKSVSCYTWSSNPSSCDSDEGLSFKRWWMQNVPGKNNNMYYNGKGLRNWWIFIGNFDVAMNLRKLTY